MPVTSGAPRKIADKVSMALYEPSGYLVCFHAGQLLSMPFDRERREVRGSGVPLANGTALLGWGISREGSLVYAAQPPARLVWVSRTGVEEATAVPVGHYLTPRLAPDGTRVALSTLSTMVENPDVWIFDLARAAMTRFTTEPGRDYAALWAPDGRRLYFTHQDTRNTILGKADGASIAEPLLTSGSELWPSGWLHDGTTMVVERDDYKGTGSDIAVLPRGAADTTPLIHEPLDQSNPAISPDGRLIAYESNETGRMEVYVRRLPGLEDRTQVSRVGGMLPLWGRDSAELFYVEGDKMMAAGIESAPTLRVSDSHMLFRGDYRINAARDHDYDRRHDRFLMLKDDTSEGDPRDLHVVLNWTAEAKRLAVQERR